MNDYVNHLFIMIVTILARIFDSYWNLCIVIIATLYTFFNPLKTILGIIVISGLYYPIFKSRISTHRHSHGHAPRHVHSHGHAPRHVHSHGHVHTPAHAHVPRWSPVSKKMPGAGTLPYHNYRLSNGTTTKVVILGLETGGCYVNSYSILCGKWDPSDGTSSWNTAVRETKEEGGPNVVREFYKRGQCKETIIHHGTPLWVYPLQNGFSRTRDFRPNSEMVCLGAFPIDNIKCAVINSHGPTLIQDIDGKLQPVSSFAIAAVKKGF